MLPYAWSWIGHAALAVVLTLVLGRDGAAAAIGFYVLREMEDTLYRPRGAPWWDRVLDVAAPVAAALITLTLR